MEKIKKEMRAKKFIFTNEVLLCDAIKFMEDHVPYKNYGFRIREYDDFIVIVAEQLPEANELNEPEFVAWKEMTVPSME